MCSIMGYCGASADYERFMEGFEKTISRGPDDSRVVDTGNGYLGFHRLAIMGLTPSGMQPFSLGSSYVVCNGEIYGFEKLKKELSDKYTFVSESDCEVLLPMYRNMEQTCLPCWMQSLPVSSTMGRQIPIWRPEILLESVLCIMDMMRME